MKFIFISILIFIFYSCKKQPLNNAPEVEILFPLELNAYSALDTIIVRANIRDYDSKSINVSIFLENQDQSPVLNNTLFLKFNESEIHINIPYVLNDRWIPSGEYFLTITAHDGVSHSQDRKKIFINAIPKKFKGILIGVKNLSIIDIYVSDTIFNFQKAYTFNNILTGMFDYHYSCFVSIHNSGKACFYSFPEWNLYKEISGLNKVGTPFKIDLKYLHPFIYMTNANGSIIGVDKNGDIRKNIKVMFSPFKINFFNNEWIFLSETYPNPYTYIEVPFKQKFFLKHGQLIDILPLDNDRWLVIEQKNNQVIWHEYKPLYNILNQFNQFNNGIYNGGIVLNNKILLFINNEIFELNKTYGTLHPLYHGDTLSLIKYEEINDLITGVNNNTLYFIKNGSFSLMLQKELPGPVVFYDFIYE